MVSPTQNNAFTLVQRVIARGEPVVRDARGDFRILGPTKEVLDAAASLGLRASRRETREGDSMQALRPVRVGLWDRYGGSMPSGWVRWILEKYEIPYTRVFAKELDAGDLAGKYDVLIFPDGATFGSGRFNVPDEVPEEYRDTLGAVSKAKTVPRLKEFLQAGGRVVTIGSATGLASSLDLPVEDALVGEDGKPLPRSKYYVPGSILQARVDATLPIAFGMPSARTSPSTTAPPSGSAPAPRRRD